MQPRRRAVIPIAPPDMARPAHAPPAGWTTPSARRRTLLAVAAGLVVAPFAALRAVADPVPKRGGVLNFAVDAEPPNYDCHANVSFATLHPIAPHYSTLLKFDTANYPDIEGDLAQSWTVSPDRLTYTFKLHPNVLFHDGSPLTSQDVKASYETDRSASAWSCFGAPSELCQRSARSIRRIRLPSSFI